MFAPPGSPCNTYSRMESNGEKGRIHVSQDTADELIKVGKSHWIRAREGTITAKGKGEMQTYWITPNIARTSKSARTSQSRSSSDRELDGSEV